VNAQMLQQQQAAAAAAAAVQHHHHHHHHDHPQHMSIGGVGRREGMSGSSQSSPPLGVVGIGGSGKVPRSYTDSPNHHHRAFLNHHHQPSPPLPSGSNNGKRDGSMMNI